MHDISATLTAGKAFLAQHQPEKAMTACDAVLALQPTHSDAVLLKLEALMALRRYGEARQLLDHHQWNPKDAARLWLIDGKLLALQGRWEAAVDALEMALSRDPRLCDAWADKGNALLRLGRYKEAITAFDQVLTLQPDNADALQARNRARADEVSSRVSDALPDLLALLDALATLFSR